MSPYVSVMSPLSADTTQATFAAKILWDVRYPQLLVLVVYVVCNSTTRWYYCGSNEYNCCWYQEILPPQHYYFYYFLLWCKYKNNKNCSFPIFTPLLNRRSSRAPSLLLQWYQCHHGITFLLLFVIDRRSWPRISRLWVRSCWDFYLHLAIWREVLAIVSFRLTTLFMVGFHGLVSYGRTKQLMDKKKRTSTFSKKQ